MLTVYKFVDAWGLPDLSPFCIKLETYLRIAGVAYEAVVGDANKAPRRKLPWVHDGEHTLADSDTIIHHLEAGRAVPLDRDLSPHDRAVAEAVRTMLEEAHYFVIVYVRWCTPEGRAIYRPVLSRYCAAVGIARPLHSLMIGMATLNMRAQAWMQGTARRDPAEIMALGQRHWTAVAELLGDRPFLLGERPTSVDATVYAFLVSTIDAPFDSPIKAHALADARLVAYRDRMRARFWA